MTTNAVVPKMVRDAAMVVCGSPHSDDTPLRHLLKIGAGETSLDGRAVSDLDALMETAVDLLRGRFLRCPNDASLARRLAKQCSVYVEMLPTAGGKNNDELWFAAYVWCDVDGDTRPPNNFVRRLAVGTKSPLLRRVRGDVILLRGRVRPGCKMPAHINAGRNTLDEDYDEWAEILIEPLEATHPWMLGTVAAPKPVVAPVAPVVAPVAVPAALKAPKRRRRQDEALLEEARVYLRAEAKRQRR